VTETKKPALVQAPVVKTKVAPVAPVAAKATPAPTPVKVEKK
jgi:hypothetical protein